MIFIFYGIVAVISVLYFFSLIYGDYRRHKDLQRRLKIEREKKNA